MDNYGSMEIIHLPLLSLFAYSDKRGFKTKDCGIIIENFA